MVDINNATEFWLTYCPGDGTVADMNKRFRVPPSGPQIRTEDGTTLTGSHEVAAGSRLIVPKAPDTPLFANATWPPVSPKDGETLADMVKRVQADGPQAGEVYHPDTKDTLVYIWLDWRNTNIRAGILQDLAEDARKALDADPSTAKLKATDLVNIPLKPHTLFLTPVAPGPSGASKGPASMVDVSDSDLAKLQEALGAIELTLSSILDNRKVALAVQKQCDQWLEQMNAIRKDAVFDHNAWTSMDAAAGDGNRPQFIAAMDALISKAAPLLLKSPVSTLNPPVAKGFVDQIATLFAQITNKDTIRLLAEVIPLQGDIPWAYGQSLPQAKFTIDHVCELAATAAYWIAEGASRANASTVLEAAMSAMAAGSPPSEKSTSIVDFAVAIPFYPDTANPECRSIAPVACTGAVSQVFEALKAHQALADSDGSIAGATLARVGAGQAKVLEQYGWTSYAADFEKATKDEFKLWKAFSKAYSAPEKDQVPDKVAALKAASVVDGMRTSGADRWETNDVEFAAHMKFGQEKMDKARAAFAALDSPDETFTSVFKGVDGWFPGLFAVGTVLSKCTGDFFLLASDKDGSKNDLNSFKGGVDLVRDTMAGLSKLKLVTTVETQEFVVMLGRVSLVVGVAVELCEVVEAVQAGDVVGAISHAALAAAGVCFLIGGTAFVVVGAGLLVGGTIVLVARGDLFKSDVGIGMKALLPDEKPAGDFESKCRDAFGLSGEIDSLRTAFKGATFDMRLIGPDIVRRQNPGAKL